MTHSTSLKALQRLEKRSLNHSYCPREVHSMTGLPLLYALFVLSKCIFFATSRCRSWLTVLPVCPCLMETRRGNFWWISDSRDRPSQYRLKARCCHVNILLIIKQQLWMCVLVVFPVLEDHINYSFDCQHWCQFLSFFFILLTMRSMNSVDRELENFVLSSGVNVHFSSCQKLWGNIFLHIVNFLSFCH